MSITAREKAYRQLLRQRVGSYEYQRKHGLGRPGEVARATDRRLSQTVGTYRWQRINGRGRPGFVAKLPPLLATLKKYGLAGEADRAQELFTPGASLEEMDAALLVLTKEICTGFPGGGLVDQLLQELLASVGAA
jgi:hypothetical protein